VISVSLVFVQTQACTARPQLVCMPDYMPDFTCTDFTAMAKLSLPACRQSSSWYLLGPAQSNFVDRPPHYCYTTCLGIMYDMCHKFYEIRLRLFMAHRTTEQTSVRCAVMCETAYRRSTVFYFIAQVYTCCCSSVLIFLIYLLLLENFDL